MGHMPTNLHAQPNKATTLAVVRKLKEAGQDFEFYPTTVEQIKVVTDDILSLLETHEFNSRYHQEIKLLDVGAGDGRVLLSMKQALETTESNKISIEMLAIEKAPTHTNAYRKKGIALVGTEFDQTNFISKSASIAFVNPPYSSFSHWLCTLISQLNFKVLYAIVPERWQADPMIAKAIEARQIKTTTVLAESDFLDGQRAARAKVQIVRFAFNDFEADIVRYAKLSEERRNYACRPTIGRDSTEPFQLFIENELGLKQTYSSVSKKFSEYQEIERIRKELETEGTASYALVESNGVLPALLDNYEKDMQHTLDQYKKISELDTGLLQELGVEYEAIRTGVKDKLIGYRSVYWSLLFSHFDALSSRLTTKHKSTLLNTLKTTSLDFTYTNALYVVSYAVEMANELIEESLIDVYKSLTSEAAILRHYVSNEHMYTDRWRHNSESPNKHARYILDYRFICSHSYNFGSYDSGLNEDARNFVNDLMVAFKLLGYENIETDTHYSHITSGSKLTVTGTDAQGKSLNLLVIRFFKNGNRHCQFDQNCMLRLNVTCSRLMGWVRSKPDYEHQTECTTPVSRDIWHISEAMKVLPSTVLALTCKAA